ncbi:MAG TPA: methyltransferase domain-containing protein [Anaerolineales bacterium]|nr:methyltransferase domain-containing protein [Anaerolineales bacterium]
MDNKTLVQQQFGANAAAYATSTVHAKGASLPRLVELTQPRAGWRALDIATGAGHTAFAFAPHVTHVTASDLTPEMLTVATRLAQEKGLTNVDFREADAEALPFDAATFDLVTCRIAPHHFADVPRFVQECARVLVPGGVLAIVDNIVPENPTAADFVNAFEKYRDPSHVRCLSAAEWADAYEQAGIRLTHAEEAKKAMNFDAWADNMNASPEMRSALRKMLHEAPAQAKEFLSPQFLEDGSITFYLSEGIFIGKKDR